MHHTGTRGHFDEKALSAGYFDSVHPCHLLRLYAQWCVPDLRHRARQKFFQTPHGDGLVQDLHLFPRSDKRIIAPKSLKIKIKGRD